MAKVELSAFLIICAGPLVSILKGQDYIINLNAIFPIIISSAFVAMCEPQKLDLYLAKNDPELAAYNVFYFLVTTVALLITAPSGSILNVAISLCVASACTYLLFRFRGFRRLTGFVSRISYGQDS